MAYQGATSGSRALRARPPDGAGLLARRCGVTERVVIGDAELWHGDCREVLQDVVCDTVLVDPVWPRCPTQTIAGSDRPYELWAEVCAALPMHRRIVVVMREPP